MVESGTVRSAGGRYSRFSRSRLFDNLEKLDDRPTASELAEIVTKVQRRVVDQFAAVDVDTLVSWVAIELSRPARASYLQAVCGIAPETTDRFDGPAVVKRDGRMCWFDGRKLHDSLTFAAHRLIPAKELDLIGESIEQRVLEAGRPVATGEIRAWADERLWQLHRLVGIRYASGGSDATFAGILRRTTGAKWGHVLKRNGELEPFDRRKLMRSVELAFGKRDIEGWLGKRLTRLIEDMARDVSRSNEPMSTNEISRQVVAWLKVLDEMAFLDYLVRHRGLSVDRLAEELNAWSGFPGALAPTLDK